MPFVPGTLYYKQFLRDCSYVKHINVQYLAQLKHSMENAKSSYLQPKEYSE
jgi:hypothetical protein